MTLAFVVFAVGLIIGALVGHTVALNSVFRACERRMEQVESLLREGHAAILNKEMDKALRVDEEVDALLAEVCAIQDAVREADAR